MKLAQCHNWCECVGGDGLCKQSPIPRNRLAGIGSRKPEIQFSRSILGTIGSTHPAEPGAEPMPEPVADRLSFSPPLNLEQSHSVSNDERNGGWRREFLFRGGIIARLTQPRRDPCGTLAPIAHQPGSLKKSVNFFADFRRFAGLGEDSDCFTVSIVAGGSLDPEKQLGPPSGGPAREAFCWEGGPEGVERRGLNQTFKGVVTFLGRAKFEEASANYYVRCAKTKNVAIRREIYRKVLIYLWKSWF